MAVLLTACIPEEPPRASPELFPGERSAGVAEPGDLVGIEREVERQAEPEVSLGDRWRSPFAVSSSGRTAPRQGRTVVVLRPDTTIVASTTPVDQAAPLAPAREAATLREAPPAAPAPSRGAAQRTHQVGPGDTLSGLAQRYDVTTQQIRDLNRLPDDRIRLGQQLLIPPPRTER
jgi:LysM repeat protein